MTDTLPPYTVAEAAAVADVAQSTIVRWARKGLFEAQKQRVGWAIDRASFDAYAATYDKAEQYTRRGAGPGIVISKPRQETPREKALAMCRAQRAELKRRGW